MSESRERTNLGTALLGGFTAVAAAITLGWFDELASQSLAELSIWSFISTGAAYAFVARRSPLGFWSVASIFLLVAMCFHQGLLLYSALSLRPPTDSWAAMWFYAPLTKNAVLLVTAALCTYGLGAGIMARQRPSADAASEPQPHRVNTLGLAGFGVLGLSVGAWVYYAAGALGPTFFLASYSEYLAATARLPLSYVMYGIGLGLVLAVASTSRTWQRRAIVLFLMFAMAALPLGLRGEVLFPVAAAAALYARQHRLPGRLVTVALLVGVLTGVSVIQQVRQDGLASADLGQLSASPVRGVAELGASLRTVNAVITWHVVDGENTLRGGETYMAPFERAVLGRALDLPVPPGTADRRLMNVEMMAREGPIGGSFIAEAYRNFGLFGGVLIPLLIGLLFGSFDRRRSSVVFDAVIGVVLIALLQLVRNSFAPTPAQITIGIAVVLAAVAWANLTEPLSGSVANTRSGRSLASN